MPISQANDNKVMPMLSPRLNTTIKLLDTKLPTTGISPAKKVSKTSESVIGSGRPINGKTTSR